VKRFVSLQFLNPKIVGRIPWTGDQAVARPLHVQTQTNIHALSGIQTHDPSVRAPQRSASGIVRPAKYRRQEHWLRVEATPVD
jgi:hypothetical protein